MKLSIAAFTFMVAAGFATWDVLLAQEQPALKKVATFEHQVTGVTVGKDDRIFVNFPRWTEDSPVSVAEVMKDGSIKPFPDEGWNSWRNRLKNKVTPHDHWVCVQSVVADHDGNLWVLDPASPAIAGAVPGGPKLVKIDLATNKVTRTIAFDEKAAPPYSYLNDVRFSPDIQAAYITDSGLKGALVVVDLKSGTARRLLEGHPTAMPEKDVVVHADGKELRRPDGRTAEFASDGIELSKDGKHLYWQALTGKTLYRIPTDALHDATMSNEALAAKIERIGENGVADGLWIDRAGTMYISALEEDSIKTRKGEKVETLIRDKELRWPDTFAESSDGTIYVTASRIQDSAQFDPKAGPALETYLFTFKPAE
jgi:sugar lactone lactonase YvrE